MQEHGAHRTFLGEGPVVVGTRVLKKGSAPMHVIDIGMPENMLSWALTPDLPMLKVERTAYMAAVPYSEHFYIIDFLPGASHRMPPLQRPSRSALSRPRACRVPAETPAEVLKAFEKVLAEHTSFAVSDLTPGDEREAPVSHIDNAATVTAASGQTFTTTSSTADKIRRAGESISAGVMSLGDHVGRGIVHAGTWYRKRSEGKQKDVKVSEKTAARCAAALTPSEISLALRCAREVTVPPLLLA